MVIADLKKSEIHIEFSKDCDSLELLQIKGNTELLPVVHQICSEIWLKYHGLKALGINEESLFTHLAYVPLLGKYVKSKYSDGVFYELESRCKNKHINICSTYGQLIQVNEKLEKARELYTNRLDWLSSGSRLIFGVITEKCATFVLDIKNLSVKAHDLFLWSFEILLRDQVKNIYKFNIIKVQDLVERFSENLVDVNNSSIESAIEWLWNLDTLSEVTCFALPSAIKVACSMTENDSIYLLTENDSSIGAIETLLDLSVSIKMPLNVVSYCCEKESDLNLLCSLAKRCNGRFHSYSVKMTIPNYQRAESFFDKTKPGIIAKELHIGGPNSSWGERKDCIMIFNELEKCRSLITRIQTVIRNQPTPTKNEILHEHSITRTPNTTSICNIACSKREDSMTSNEWIAVRGVKANNLDIYDILDNLTFKHCDGVVGVLKPPKKLVENDKIETFKWLQLKSNIHLHEPKQICNKLVNAKYCESFAHVRWKDGRLRHVQISHEVFRAYENRMKVTLDAIKRRIDWLRLGSRELFSSIVEDNVYILLDISGSMKPHFDKVKQKLSQLFTEQLKHKNGVNFIAFNSLVQIWREKLVQITDNNLQEAMEWLNNLTCRGTTNTLAALNVALSDPDVQGIYILSDGRPDQNPKVILGQLSSTGRDKLPVHTISFNCGDQQANEFLLQCAKLTGGRFTYYNDVPNIQNNLIPLESEDVRLLKEEYQYGLDCINKLSKICEEYKQLSNNNNNNNIAESCSNRKFPLKRISRNKQVTFLRNSKSILCESENLITKNLNSRPSIPSIIVSPPSDLAELCSSASSENSTVNLFKTGSLTKRLIENNDEMIKIKKKPKKKHLKISEYQTNLGNICMNAIDIANPNSDFILMETKEIPNVPTWLAENGLDALGLTLLDMLAPSTIPLRSSYIPLMGKFVFSPVIKSIMPLAYISPYIDIGKHTKKPKVRLANPSLVDVKSYLENLQPALKRIERRLIYLVHENLSKFNLDKLKENCKFTDTYNWTKKLCFYKHGVEIFEQMKIANWPYPEEGLKMLKHELNKGFQYWNEAEKLGHKIHPKLFKNHFNFLPCGHLKL